MKKFLFIIITAMFCTVAQAQNVGIGTNAPAHKLHVSSTVTNSFGGAIVGINLGSVGSGIIGNSNTAGTYGVQGSSTSGIGVWGSSNEYRAVYGSSVSGTALYGFSSDGYGIQVVGKVKISGGNTNPTNGAVLTSDATGNAVWKKNNVGFSVSEPNPNLLKISSQINTTVHLFKEDHDYGNDYNAYTGSSPSFGNSTFVAPVSGLYHFDAALGLSGFLIDLQFPMLSIVVQRGATKIIVAEAEFSPVVRITASIRIVQASISKDVKLLAGDIVYLNVYHYSDGQVEIWNSGASPHFGGHLIFED